MLKAFLVGLLLTLTAGFGVIVWLSLRPAPVPPAPAAAAPPPRSAILVAARAIQAGTLLKPEDVTALDVEAAAVPEGARPDTQPARAELLGAMARHAMAAQQAILPPDILRPSDGGFLAAVLAPQHRAVSVAVDAVSGTAGLIWPGDRVDLILTQALDDQATPVGRRTFGETVLRDVRVIAVDQQMVRGASPDAATPGNRTVTLEVLPAAAEMVAVAVRLGKVALTVRAVAKDGMRLAENTRTATPFPPTTFGQDVSPALVPKARTTTDLTVRVFQGVANEKEFTFK